MLHHQIFRMPDPGQPMVLAAFSYRYDAHLVPDLLENVRPAVHGFVAWDDRAAGTALSDEPARRAQLIAAARGLGAGWLLTPDPDERFEQGLAAAMPALLAQGDRTLWLFALHEMFSPTQFRSDGLWGAKSVLRLFPLAAAEAGPAQVLHGSWAAPQDGYRPRSTRLNLYHLRMASPVRRQLRRDLYAAADPSRRFQPIGYDYLVDERAMQLEPLPEGRFFTPPFAEDHALWAPDPGAIGNTGPDPYEVRFDRAAASARHRGQLAAHHVLLDLSQHSPDDADLPLLAAHMALLAGQPDLALTAVESLDAKTMGTELLRATALLHLGQPFASTLANLQARVPDSPILAALADEISRPIADLTAPIAAWRRLAPDATCHDGARVEASDLAVIVIGYKNQPGLLEAVQSLLDQDEVPEIVVVNSGGGEVVSSLAPVLDRIRLIATDQPLYVGAARNIGVAASRARYLAFLSGDCLARPGWVSRRLVRHRAGARSVATAVLGEAGSGLIALAANRLRYASRHPDADPRWVVHYGQSYCRTLLSQLGIFPPGLRVGEDTALNHLAARITAPVWAPEVQTVHRDIASLAVLVRDEVARGNRRAAHPPFRGLAGMADPHDTLGVTLAQRLAIARDLEVREAGLTAAERRALGATQWLLNQADRHGVTLGMRQIADANTLARAGGLANLTEAVVLDPQSVLKTTTLAKLHLGAGNFPAAEAAFRAALALEPGRPDAAEGLVTLVTRRDGPRAGWITAEELVLEAPAGSRPWQLAAEAAHAAGQPEWAVALGQVMLTRSLNLAAAHAVLSRLHAAAGDVVAAAFRAQTVRRLHQAAEARR